MIIMKEPAYPVRVRQKWYFLVDKYNWKVIDVCERYFIPRKTYYKWRRKDLGSRAYSSKRLHPATKLTPEIKRFIIKTKERTNYGPAKMRLAVKAECRIVISTTIIYRFYLRKGLIRRPQKRLPWYEPMKEKLIITRSGEGVQCDVKYVMRENRRHYQFSVLDPYTERFHCSIFPTRESLNAITALTAAETAFGFPIHSVQTDNGSEYRGEFHRWCEKQGIHHYFIPKKSPWWNGKVERVHRTIDDEYYLNPRRPWQTLEEWLTYYNSERIHLTLGVTPLEYTKKCHP